MTAFPAIEGFNIEDYKSFSFIRLTKNGKYSIRLMYGYKGKNAIYGGAYIVDSLTMALTIIEIIEQFQRVDTENETDLTLDDLLDDTIPIQQAQDEPQPIVMDKPIDTPEITPMAAEEPIDKPKNTFFKAKTQSIKNKRLNKEIAEKQKHIKLLEVKGFNEDSEPHIEAMAELNKLLEQLKDK
jgi:hypothetical protein